jgi:CubicO group peptidase (beta-lactamase class C family)
MYKKELPRVTPESVGISSRTLLKMLKSIENETVEPHGVMIARHGKVCLETWWKPYDKDTVHVCHSFGKSYTCAGIGAACTRGLLSVNDKIIDIFDDDIRRLGITPNENLRQLTVEHVLMMANGMSRHPMTGEKMIDHYLQSDFNEKPGTIFHYNTAGSCLLGAILARATGKSVLEFVTETVFEKVGIESDKLWWCAYRNGIHVAPGVASILENNLRLGMFFLQEGNWNGEQIVDAAWMRRAITRRIDNQNNNTVNIDGRSGYGYQLWMCTDPDSFRFSGGHGQDAMMSRKNDIAVATNEAAVVPEGEMCVLRTVIDTLFTPDLPETLPGDPEGYAELRAYLNSRSMGQWESRPVPAELSVWDGIYRVEKGFFHIEPELHALGDNNLNADFYYHENMRVQSVSIRALTDNTLELCLDQSRIVARLDGELQPVPTRGEMPPYQTTVSTAFFEGDTLTVDTRYIQTAFSSRLVFVRDGNRLTLNVRKERRVMQDLYFTYDGIILNKIV